MSAFESSDTHQILVITDKLKAGKKIITLAISISRNLSFPLQKTYKGSLKKTVKTQYTSGIAPVN